jgi:hypothetical protein
MGTEMADVIPYMMMLRRRRIGHRQGVGGKMPPFRGCLHGDGLGYGHAGVLVVPNRLGKGQFEALLLFVVEKDEQRLG